MAVGNSTEYRRLRRRVGTTAAVLPDPVVEEYFEEAREKYPTDWSKTVVYARVIALEEIRANAALLGKYTQNRSTEDLTTVFKNLQTMLQEAKDELAVVADPIDPATVGNTFFTKARGQRGR